MAQYNGTPALLHCDTAAGAKCRRASGAAVVDFRSPYRNEPTRYGHPFPLSARGPSAAGCAYDSEDELLIGSQCLTVV